MAQWAGSLCSLSDLCQERANSPELSSDLHTCTPPTHSNFPPTYTENKNANNILFCYTYQDLVLSPCVAVLRDREYLSVSGGTKVTVTVVSG